MSKGHSRFFLLPMVLITMVVSSERVQREKTSYKNAFMFSPVETIFFSVHTKMPTIVLGPEWFFVNKGLSLRVPLLAGFKIHNHETPYVFGSGLETKYFFKRRFRGLFGSLEGFYGQYSPDDSPKSKNRRADILDNYELFYFRTEIGYQWLFKEAIISLSSGPVLFFENVPSIEYETPIFPGIRLNFGFPLSALK